MNKELSKKLTDFLLVSASVFVIIILLYLFFTTILKWILPFVLAYILAYITNPIVTFMEKRMKIPRKISSAITIVFSLSIFGTFITLIISRVAFEIKRLSVKIPGLYEKLSEYANGVYIKGMNIYISLPEETSQFINNSLEDLTGILTSALGSLTEYTTKFAYSVVTSLPSLLIFMIILVISTYFMSSDKEKITRFITKQLPSTWPSRLVNIKNDLIIALLGYIKAQLILMSITFIIMTTGFLIIGVDYAILLGLLIGFIDALPILGTGGILIPWAIISLISGNFTLALYLIILYGVAVLTRQLLEPKVLGSQIGLYPLITLIAMYVGLQIFGILGMIIGPISLMIFINLHKAKIIKLWKD